jgi:predicted nucleic acid-binding protein
MRTAVDTNVVLAVWSREPAAVQVAAALGRAKSEGALVVSAAVYAELLAYPNMTEILVNGFLKATGVDVDFEFQRATWLEAGRRFARYAGRRRRAGGGEQRRLLVDFLIGARHGAGGSADDS